MNAQSKDNFQLWLKSADLINLIGVEADLARAFITTRQKELKRLGMIDDHPRKGGNKNKDEDKDEEMEDDEQEEDVEEEEEEDDEVEEVKKPKGKKAKKA